MTLEEKINDCETMPELDKLRLDVIHKSKEQIREDPNCLNAKGQAPIQRDFIKKKSKLKRIPLKDRNW